MTATEAKDVCFAHDMADRSRLMYVSYMSDRRLERLYVGVIVSWSWIVVIRIARKVVDVGR